MKKIMLLLLCASCQVFSHAQSKAPVVSPLIDSLLADMKRFQESESRSDSVALHPLGSFKEADFKRRYEFYKAEKQKLDAVNQTAFSFDDQINAELLNYIIEDELSNYRFKAYLNPILADEGFHTGLAGMSGTVFTTKKDVEDYEKIFVSVQIESEYPGGKAAWMRYLNKNFRYPQEAMDNEIQGSVMVQFIVDKEGNVSNVEAVSGPDALKEEAMRVIKKSGKWNPAIQNGRQVKSYKRQPITYRLE